ncbi:unnamed protein product [Lactuca saligna]|uniref:14-3-3 domain-containing protein n=1 Tax=Lactuca saligna TaxID=75948 RepID=A0AA36EFF3_LACSI|nr:unnamed protein product [Lactuca saligna]
MESRIINKVSSMVKSSELIILEKVDYTDQSNELRVKSQRSDFMVKKVREDVNMKIRELREDMQREVQSVQQDYASINKKVDIICEAVTKYVKLYESMSPQLTHLSKLEKKNFGELIVFLKELKQLSVKPVSTWIITPKFLSDKFIQFEAILHKQLSPLTRISSILPTVLDAPPSFAWVQGGEKIDELKKTGEEVKVSKEDSKVVGKVFPSKIPITKPIIVSAGLATSTVVTMVPITRLELKGVVIGEESESRDKGKAKIIENTKEEKKDEVNAELERMRLVQSVMTLRAQDPVGLEKGDPSKQYNYETIEAKFMFDHMCSFEKFKAKIMCKDKQEGKKLKIRFHSVLVKAPEEVCTNGSYAKQVDLKKYEDGEICLKPLGVVFAGKDKAGRVKRLLFQTYEVERYATSQFTNLIVRMNQRRKNSEGDKKEIKKEVETELSNVYGDIMTVIDKHLIPSSSVGQSIIFYYKMKGDYYRYLVEFKYEDLSPTHPILLGLPLNFYGFYYEIMDSPVRACQLATQAFDKPISELDSLSDESYQDSTLIIATTDGLGGMPFGRLLVGTKMGDFLPIAALYIVEV